MIVLIPHLMNTQQKHSKGTPIAQPYTQSDGLKQYKVRKTGVNHVLDSLLCSLKSKKHPQIIIHYFHFPASLSTSAQPSDPLTQTTVAECLSTASPTRHLMSSGFGQGHSAGVDTHKSVSGQRYELHEAARITEISRLVRHFHG